MDLSKLTPEEIDKLTPEQLDQVDQSLPPLVEDQSMPDVDNMSEEELNVLDAKLADIPDEGQPAKAFGLGLENVVSANARPFFSSVVKTAVEPIERAIHPELKEKYGGYTENLGQFFRETRDREAEKQLDFEKKNPKAVLAGELVGNAILAPILPGSGLKAAAAIGGIYGGGEAIGKGYGLKDTAMNVVKGAAISGGVGAAFKYGKKAFEKTAATVSGIPEDIIEHYGAREKQVEAMAKKYGKDFATAADDIRTSILDGISSTIKRMNDKVSEQIAKIGDEVVDAGPIKNSLEFSKAKLNKVLQKNEIEEIDDFISKIDELTDDYGAVALSDINDLKYFLYGRAKGAYQKNGQMFLTSAKAKIAAKKAASEAKKILDNKSPEIKDANDTLSKLHAIEDRVTGNLFKLNKPEGPIFAAASGENKANQNILKSLEKLTGKESITMAKDITAAKHFGDPKLLPEGMTGLTFTRATPGMALGAAAAGQMGFPLALGAAGGYAASSPMAIKQYSKLGGLLRAGIGGIEKVGGPEYVSKTIGGGLSQMATGQSELPPRQPMQEQIPAKNLMRNAPPASMMMGGRGQMTKMALQQLSTLPDEQILQAQPKAGSDNLFVAMQEIQQNQDLNPLSNSVYQLNSQYGVEITKDIFAGLSKIKGAITTEKLYQNLATIPESARIAIIDQFKAAYDRNAPTVPVVIPAEDRAQYTQDVMDSNLNSIEKSKAVLSLQKKGIIQPDLYRKISLPEGSTKAVPNWKQKAILK